MEDKKNSLYTLSNQMRDTWNPSDMGVGITPPYAERIAAHDVSEFTPAPDILYGCTGLVTSVVPKQKWNETYEPDMGFERGTIFPCLDMPFMGEGACRRER